MDGAIIRNLQNMILKVTFEKPSGWSFKVRNYNKSIKIVTGEGKLFKKKITTDPEEYYKELMQKNGYKNPVKIVAKIMELYNKVQSGEDVNTVVLDEVKDFLESPAASASKAFSKIYAVGPAKIKELIEKKKIYTIEALRKAVEEEPDLLNKKQHIGLKYYEDLNERIPRKEITRFRKGIEKLIKRDFDDDIKMTITGSYRRGQRDSGDMDMLLTSSCYENKSLNMILEKLNELKLIKEVLASGKKKFMGVIQFPGGKARHLDIIETTKEDYPFAVLYFTGSGPFNIQMRAHALKLGYSLNEYNMTYKGTKNKVTKEDIQSKINKETFETETDIFNFLDIPYREPKKRIKL